MKQISGYVHSFETFGSVDGPGIRFMIFLAGCGMRCQYCHNPDTWRMAAGTKYSVSQILEKALRYRPYWGKKGGITVSGGEPLMQIDFLIELFREAKALGINTALDTSGGNYRNNVLYRERFETLMQFTDLVILDLKEMNPERHLRLTGMENTHILAMAQHISTLGKAMWIRHVLVPERSDYDEDLLALRKFIDTLKTVEKVEVLPYHTLGIYKWADMGREYPLVGIDPPTAERIANANRILVGEGGVNEASHSRAVVFT